MTLDLAYRSGGAWNEAISPARNSTPRSTRLSPSSIRPSVPTAMKDVEQILRDSGSSIQPYWPNRFSAAATTVHGFVLHPADYAAWTASGSPRLDLRRGRSSRRPRLRQRWLRDRFPFHSP